MNYLEIDRALVDITKAKIEDCRGRLNSIPKENVHEKKAVQIELGMYQFCGNAGHMFHALGERAQTIKVRLGFVTRYLPKYPKLKKVWEESDEEERLCFVAAIQGELFMRDQFIPQYRAQLAKAEEAGDAKGQFEMTVKLGAMKSMFAAYEAWRVENGIYPNMFEEVEG